MLNMRKVVFALIISSVTLSLFATENASTPFGKGVFRYSPFGHSLYADVHPNTVRLDVPYCSNNVVYDWGKTGKSYRWNSFSVFGFQLPLWYGQLVDERFALSVTVPASANLWLDIFEPKTAPVVNTDYRIGGPTMAFLHRLNRGFAHNYSVAWTPFKHESTHLGDEMEIQHVTEGYALRRVNVSYNYTEVYFTLNEAENRYEENHCFRIGFMLLWDWNQGWYNIEIEDGNADLASPKLSPWELFLQYQYQSPTSKHGFQGIASAEIRNRALYGYVLDNHDKDAPDYRYQQEKRRFTYNIFVGARYNIPNYDGYFSRFAFGLRAYHGNCPYGQFRSIRNYSQIGLSLIFE